MPAPQTIAGRFEIEAEAASGGMGTVYRAIDRATGARVAVKILHRTGDVDQQRFVREATILADLVHPAIVRYVAHGILDGGAPYLVMEWVEGETLDARLRHTGMSVAETVTMARRVASALAFAHARDVVHRDIKPSNLIFPDGAVARAMVIDFGVARVAAPSGSLTETGSVVGTPSYMSPEQVRGDRAIGPPVDVFALGCVIHECLTGRVTFQGLRFLALRAKILLWEPPRARELSPDVPPALDALVARMLAKGAADRPRDAGEVLAQLDALGDVVDATPTRRPRRASDPPTEAMRPRGAAPRLVSIVLASSLEGVDPTSAPTMTHEAVGTLRSSLDSVLVPYAAAVDVLHDGALIATLSETSSPAELARRAAAAARAIRRQLDAAVIAIVTGEARPDEEAALIEQGVHALSKDAMSLVFARPNRPGPPAGAIRVDARTAALLGAEAALVHVKGAYFLVPEAPG